MRYENEARWSRDIITAPVYLLVLVAIAAVVVLAAFAVSAQTVAASPDDVAAAFAFACDNRTAIIPYLEWAVGVLGVPVAASVLSNLRNKLPPGLIKVLEVVAGNLTKLAEEKIAVDAANKAASAAVAAKVIEATPPAAVAAASAAVAATKA